MCILLVLTTKLVLEEETTILKRSLRLFLKCRIQLSINLIKARRVHLIISLRKRLLRDLRKLNVRLKGKGEDKIQLKGDL
jgi:hypothetical protein